jgi:hypothetical protein
VYSDRLVLSASFGFRDPLVILGLSVPFLVFLVHVGVGLFVIQFLGVQNARMHVRCK